MTLLTLDEMAAARRDLDDWKIEPGMMEKEFSFPDFKTALDFVNKVG
ncbi:4a-hydroxytetrahydrobiopterin dehydratase, partial [Candidatus Woesearchaeota archaeon]|nr:4a-hydroxytetrahydrobiopterin dehydratase [Candidatus Woesearchaeota archaeon]